MLMLRDCPIRSKIVKEIVVFDKSRHPGKRRLANAKFITFGFKSIYNKRNTIYYILYYIL